ncbi:unnamed protein product [Somion occarium]|uniref:Zn(2)-C6 fungal-type domain-containing protein n=1 Tax=Somion occarium TaxID=3059160 RepID=A0ABP1DLN5_9APHY
MDDIRFVLEAPHLVQGQKKRPRLVTSCDNCRLKKVKCIQHTPNVKCEACANAQIPCRFRDRERYFAERSRIMAGSNSDGRRSAQCSRASSSWDSHTPSPECEITPPIVPCNARVPGIAQPEPYDILQVLGQPSSQMSLSCYPQANTSSSSYASDSINSLNGTHWDYGSTSSYLGNTSNAASLSTYGIDFSNPQQSSEPSQTPLFDTRHPDRPHANLMAHFIQAFFDNLSSYFPFLSYENAVERFLNQSLPPMLASCIAALATRYVDIPEITSRGVTNVQAAYCSNAETLLASLVNYPVIDTLHAVILLAWTEYKRSRTSTFCYYAQMALHMAWSLGLSDEMTIQSVQTEYQLNILQSTWACVNQLTATADQTKPRKDTHESERGVCTT